ncbi:hypothetical protein OEG84_18725 [Hoeflea sp. G2-23]|uniref:Uncharacterized protein n=1 Tax=Hoeflea algicola TaxID=2983763 RepID=A0ABT3ZDH6_9HYPH|nr:hypothetical protein [Hoeflea algicola]MCY0149686.1 hypothetical protein [Hoeflea algicola]
MASQLAISRAAATPVAPVFRCSRLEFTVKNKEKLPGTTIPH